MPTPFKYAVYLTKGSLLVARVLTEHCANVVETRTTRTWWVEPGFVIQEVKPGVAVDAEDAYHDLNAALAVARREQLVIVIDATGCRSVTRAARQVLMNGTASRLKALALVTGTGFGLVVANFFVALFPSKQTTVKLFETRASAVEWSAMASS